jgi:hypothetical protein
MLMMTLPFESILARVGLQPADIERVVSKELRSVETSLLRTFKVTVTTAAELRQVLNPHGTIHPVAVPDAAPVHAGEAPPGATWAERQFGRPRAHRMHAMDILHAAVLGPESALATHGLSVEKAWLPSRVTVAAAKTLTIAAGEVVVLGDENDRVTPYSAVFDTITIAAGGQLVLASPTFLTVTTLNRNT